MIEFRETDPSGKVGVYALQLFPEVRQYFRPDDGDGDAAFAGPPRSPKTPNGAAFPEEGNPAQLTEDAAVCTGVRLAPRVGFEPTTRRLTAGCSTIELSRIASPLHI